MIWSACLQKLECGSLHAYTLSALVLWRAFVRYIVILTVEHSLGLDMCQGNVNILKMRQPVLAVVTSGKCSASLGAMHSTLIVRVLIDEY